MLKVSKPFSLYSTFKKSILYKTETFNVLSFFLFFNIYEWANQFNNQSLNLVYLNFDVKMYEFRSIISQLTKHKNYNNRPTNHLKFWIYGWLSD